MRKTSGFTLIEVMISMAILAILSILTAQTMRTAIQDRETVSTSLTREAKVSDAIRIMRNDINAAYHYRDIFVTEMNNAAKPDGTPTPVPGQPGFNPNDPTAPPPPPPPAQSGGVPGAAAAATPRPTPAITTGFVGDSESVYFTSLSNVRTIQDIQQSDQAKVGYYVHSCQAHEGNRMVASKCLYRSITPYLDEEIEKPGDETILLEHVDQFKLRYLGPGKDDPLEYVDTWKTGKNGDANTKENFPYAVEVTIATDDKEDKKSQRVVGSALIPIRFPNNAPKTSPTPGGQDATNQPGSFNRGVSPPPPHP